MPGFKIVIFDLDDTLFDCSEQLIPRAVCEMCRAMVDAGLDTRVGHAMDERSRFLMTNPRSSWLDHLISHFGVRSGFEASAENVKSAGQGAFFQRSVPPIKPFDETHQVLQTLTKDCSLHLVTSGHPQTQKAKIEILDVESYFRSVRVIDPSRGENKRDVFREIKENEKAPRSKCLVVGDRLDREISEGGQLGMCTCHVKRGEFQHLIPLNDWETPNFTVTNLQDLIPLCLPEEAK